MSNVTAPHVNIDSILQENRTFDPPASFRDAAYIRSAAEYERLYKQAAENPEEFWAGIAKELHWFKPWTKVLEWDAPWAKWFVGAQTNISYNCLDSHVLGGKRHKAAIIWEGEPGDQRTLTYQQLWLEVQKFSNVLLNLGVKRGDRVAIYMGMVPELPIAKIGRAHV